MSFNKDVMEQTWNGKMEAYQKHTSHASPSPNPATVLPNGRSITKADAQTSVGKGGEARDPLSASGAPLRTLQKVCLARR